ncbi:PREDICTED: uncharacterized protein LOC109589015 [Amphimedon queenslandica]|uniref:Death domain-containing protein n=2 Tax=Amphimedon queenslandica TaxID=400682 RepID=A0AAN0JUW9_AMPQE|nr:PREDICTED: uncharacterized protein LOC109589015 [Amphimedon queenslandica]|eukprot:XP_019860697.1 PREDICTED: uncharacterized protein LOC109589015 [Amphimedon queenslandica]
MEERGKMSPLDGRPTLHELTWHIKVPVKWHDLGVELQLEPRSLDAIDFSKRPAEEKSCAMFQLWLLRFPKATRRDVLEALRVIKENDIAEKYEKIWKEVESEDLAENIEYSIERCCSQIEKPAENERDWAKKFHYLKEMFGRHVLPPIKESIRVDDAKRRFRKTLHSNFGCNEEFLKVHRCNLDKIDKVEDFVQFLIDLNFSSYLNYQHLKDLAGDDCAAYFSDYEMMYHDILSKVSLSHVASVFCNNPDLVPGGIIGFPTLKFELKQPKSYPTLQDWITSLHPQLPSHIATIEAGDDAESITITYTMYPPHFLSCVLSILEESEYVKVLSSKDITTHLKLCRVEGQLEFSSTDDGTGDDANTQQDQTKIKPDIKTEESKEAQSLAAMRQVEAYSVPLPSQILHPVGIKEYKCLSDPAFVQYKGLLFTTEELKEKLTDPNTTIKVQPALLSFSGLPQSGKTTAVTRFLDNYVKETILEPISRKNYRPKEHVGIANYDLIAVSSLPGEDYAVSEAAQESSFVFGILSIFKSITKAQGKLPFIDAKAIPLKCFDNFELNEHFHHMYGFLQSQESIPKSFSNECGEPVDNFLELVPDGIALVNIWDMASSNTVHHLLSALEGYLFNSYLWLFVDLHDDLEKLDENFEIPKRDGAILLKERTRLHYLLRSCWSTRDNEKKRRGVCTMFAKHRSTEPAAFYDKVNELEDKVQPVANHIGVSELLEHTIESINLDIGHRRLHEKFQRILKDKTTSDNIPISWLFLRSLFYRFKKTFVSKDDLMEMAKECRMDEDSVNKFCKFFTSFGSIIDLSLVNANYRYVIVKPVTFLKLLDKFFNLQNDASCNHGLWNRSRKSLSKKFQG